MKINGVMSVGPFVLPGLKSGLSPITLYIFDLQIIQNKIPVT